MPDLDSVQDFEKAYGVTVGDDEPDLGDAEEAAAEPAQGRRVLSGKVKLSRRYEVRETPFEGIDIDPPRGSDFWELGDIGSWITGTSKIPQWIEAPEILRQYGARCVSLPCSRLSGEEILSALNFEDTMKVARAVRGFFTQARLAS